MRKTVTDSQDISSRDHAALPSDHIQETDRSRKRLQHRWVTH